MKIIERGTARQVKCGNCGSVLEHEDKDVYLRKLPDHRRDFDSPEPEDAFDACVNCPVCSVSLPIRVSCDLKLRLYKSAQRSDDI